MTPDKYRAAIKTLGLTQNQAGEFFGVNPVTGRRWASNGPPPAVAKLLRLMLALQFTPAYVDRVIGD
jgi:transcriptional regulator with XRE-family HTH domain